MLRHRDELITLRFLVRGTPYRNENEHGRDCRKRGNRDAPSSIPRDFGCRFAIARALVGARDIRQQHLASHAIGKMRFQALAFRRAANDRSLYAASDSASAHSGVAGPGRSRIARRRIASSGSLFLLSGVTSSRFLTL